jgi:neurotransmitter-gated ion-channel
MARWIDARLAFVPTRPTELHRQYNRTQIWIPSFAMVNAVAPRERYDTSAESDSDGSVSYVGRFHAVLSSKFMPKRFPFDSQSLLIIVHPYLRQELQVEFTAYNREVWATHEFTQYSSLAQWNLQTGEPSIGISDLYGGRRIPEARFTINVERRYAFYLWKCFCHCS